MKKNESALEKHAGKIEQSPVVQSDETIGGYRRAERKKGGQMGWAKSQRAIKAMHKIIENYVLENFVHK